MRATQHFHRGLLLGMTQKKRNSEKHTEIFLEFLVFLEEGKLKGRKTKTRKTMYTGKLPTSKKKNQEIFLGFLLILQLIKLEIKTEKKQEIFLDFLKVFQTHKNKESK